MQLFALVVLEPVLLQSLPLCHRSVLVIFHHEGLVQFPYQCLLPFELKLEPGHQTLILA